MRASRLIRPRAALLLCTLAWPASAAAGTFVQQGTASGLQIPAPIGLVNDFANVIPPENAEHIRRIAEDVRTKSKGEIAVVTLRDIGDRAAADVALQIGREWKVGKIGAPGDPTRNAGAVILLVPKESSATGRGVCFIATGNGAEGFITDADAGDICREATPFFRNRDYGKGLELVTDLTAQRFADEFHFALDTTLTPALPASPQGDQVGGMSPLALFLLLLFIYLVLRAVAGRGRGCGGCLPIFIPFGGGWGGGRGGGGGWSGGGGGGGGGFGGFGGGGGFSGGGGGSSW